MRRLRALLITVLVAPTSAVVILGAAGATGTPTNLFISEAQFNGTFVEGQNGRFGVYLQNWGAPTSDATLVRFEVDGAWLGDAAVDAGFQGIRLVEAPETWTVTAGSHTFVGIADAGADVAESDEADNVVRWSFEGQPDLPPPPAWEMVFQWRSYPVYRYTAQTFEIEYATAHTDLRWGLFCDEGALQLWLDGVLVASCVAGVPDGRLLPSKISAGLHRFTIVHAGVGSAGVDAFGLTVPA